MVQVGGFTFITLNAELHKAVIKALCSHTTVSPHMNPTPLWNEQMTLIMKADVGEVEMLSPQQDKATRRGLQKVTAEDKNRTSHHQQDLSSTPQTVSQVHQLYILF